MSNINFTCPHCSHTTELASSTEGMKGNCPSCKAEVVITPDNPEPSIVPTANKPRGKEQKRIEQQPVVLGIWLVCVFALAMFFISFFTWSSDGDKGLSSGRQYQLGVEFYYGNGVRQDYKEAMKWFRSAAEHENADAQYAVGLMHDLGESVPKNDVEAAKWYRKAAEQGHAKSQYNLGILYNNGGGIPQDSKEAYVWFSIAATGGHEQAKNALKAIYLGSSRLAEAQSRATELFKQIEERQQ